MADYPDPSANAGIAVPISTSADTSGFEKTKAAADQTTEGLKGMKSSSDELKDSLVGLASIFVIFEALKGGVEDSIKLEEAWSGVALAAEHLGQDAGTVKGQLSEFSEKLLAVTGISKEESVPALAKLYATLGDVDQATRRVALAADIAKSGLGLGFNEALQVVNSAALGNVRALRQVNIALDTTGDKGKDAEIALKKLESTFGGNAEKADTSATSMAKFLGALKEMRDGIVSVVGPALMWLVKALTLVVHMVEQGWHNITSFVKDASDAMAEAALREQGLDKEADALAAKREARHKTEAEESRKLEEKLANDLLVLDDRSDASKESLGSRDVKRTERIGKQKLEKEKDIAAEIEKLRLAGYKLDEKLAGDHYKALQIALKASLEAEESAVKEWAKKDGISEKQRAEMIQQIRTNANKERLVLQKKFDDEFSKQVEKLSRSNAEWVRQETTEIAASRKKLFDYTLRLLNEEQKHKKTMATFEKDMEKEVLGIGEALFGNTKELAVAKATISTYEGAAKAIDAYAAYPPLAAAMAAVIIAEGLAQVAQIVQQTPSGKGFDDPSNDAAAYQSGYMTTRRWAQDQIRLNAAGMEAGWRAGMMGPPATAVTNNIDQRNINNVTFQGSGILDASSIESVKRLQRALDLAHQASVGQATISRSAIVTRR